MTGCDVETSDNGDLDGFWRMSSMTSVYSSTLPGVDMRQSGLTWSFQGRMLELRDVNDRQKDIVMSFQHEGETLRVYDPYFVERDSGDIRIEDVSYLIPYGINHTDDSFTVRELSSDRMVLSNILVTLEFRKY
jgi:hypothetical protein